MAKAQFCSAPQPQVTLATSFAPDSPQLPAKPPRRQQIRDTALEMFVREGFANVSLRQLGDRIGVHPGSLYNHLDSKQSLLFELIHKHLEDLVKTVVQKVRKAPGIDDKLRAFISVHIDYQIKQQLFALLTNLELRSLEASNQLEIKKLLARYRTCLNEILLAGIQAGTFKAQHPRTAVLSVLGMLSSVCFWFHENDQQSHKQLIAQMTAMILGALRAPMH